MKYFGLWSLRFLLLSLALTPLQRLAALGKLAVLRRMLGITAATYAAVHVSLFFPYMGWSAGKMLSEIASRFYLMIGLLALLALLALAFTSTDRWIARLGSRWKALHRLVYPLTLLALLHMSLQEKIDATPALQLAGIFILLMCLRIALRLRLAVNGATLIATALAACVTTMAIEALWYGSLTGVAVSRVVAANWSLAAGLRPTQLVLLVGLLAAGFVQIQTARRLKPAVISR